MSEFDLSDFILQNIKETPLSEIQLDDLKDRAGSYEALFSKRSQQYKILGLKGKKLEESDFKKYILEHYTFLKRPVFLMDEKLFIGSEKNTVDELKKYLV